MPRSLVRSSGDPSDAGEINYLGQSNPADIPALGCQRVSMAFSFSTVPVLSLLIIIPSAGRLYEEETRLEASDLRSCTRVTFLIIGP